MPDIEIHEEGEWSGVYLDGKLVLVGDHYLANEWLRDHFGVETVQDGAFMRGQDQRAGVAQTLDEVEAYRAECRDAAARHARARAAQLREEAAELLAQAERMSQ